MFNLLDPKLQEPLFPLGEIPKELRERKLVCQRRGGGTLAVQTLIRWAKIGRNGHKLEVIRVGGTLHTSVEALFRFFSLCTNPDAGAPPLPPTRAADAHAAAERALEQDGF